MTTPKISIPTSVRRSTSAGFQDAFGTALVWVFVLAIGLVSVLGDLGQMVGRLINDLGLVGALAGTYLLPGNTFLAFMTASKCYSLFFRDSHRTRNGTPLQTTTLNHNPQHTPHDRIVSLFSIASVPISAFCGASITVRRTPPAQRTSIAASPVRTTDNMGCRRLGIASTSWRWWCCLGRR